MAISPQGDRFRWDYSVGTSMTVEARFHAAEFEGYSQQLPAGLNPVDQTWEITVEMMPPFEAAEIIKFFKYYMKNRFPFQIQHVDTGEWEWVDVNQFVEEFVDSGARTIRATLRSAGR